MNATMIWVRTCNRKRFTETTARSNVSTVITIVISCDRVRHVIIILQVTVVPAVTVIVAGVKVIFIMLTVLGSGGALLLVPLLLEQETNMVENNKLKLTTLAILFLII